VEVRLARPSSVFVWDLSPDEALRLRRVSPDRTSSRHRDPQAQTGRIEVEKRQAGDLWGRLRTGQRYPSRL
jgi:hypothetical protein